MSDSEIVVGIDVGTSAVKALSIDLGKRCFLLARRFIQTVFVLAGMNRNLSIGGMLHARFCRKSLHIWMLEISKL